jgi:hypothetical protein
MNTFIDSFRQQLLGNIRVAKEVPPAAVAKASKQCRFRSKVIPGVDVASEHPRLTSSAGCVALSRNSNYIVVGCILPAVKLQLFDATSLMCIASIPLPVSLVEEENIADESASQPLRRCSIAKLLWVRGVENVLVVSDHGMALLVPTGLRNRTASQVSVSNSDDDGSDDEDDMPIPHISIGTRLLDVDSADFFNDDRGAILTVTHTSSFLRFARVQPSAPAESNVLSCVSQPCSVTTLSATSGCVLIKDSEVSPTCWVVLFVGVSVLTFQTEPPEDLSGSHLAMTAVHTLLLGHGVVPICILRNTVGSMVRCLCWEHIEIESKSSVARRQNRHVLLVDGSVPSDVNDATSHGDALHSALTSLHLDVFAAAPLNTVVGGSRALSSLASTSLLITQPGSIPSASESRGRDDQHQFQLSLPHRRSRNESAQKTRTSNLALCVVTFDPAAVRSQQATGCEVTYHSFLWNQYFSKFNSHDASDKNDRRSSVRFVASGANSIAMWTSSCLATIKVPDGPQTSASLQSPIQFCSTARDVRMQVAGLAKGRTESAATCDAAVGVDSWSGVCVVSENDTASSEAGDTFLCCALLGTQLQLLQHEQQQCDHQSAVTESRPLAVVEDPFLVIWAHDCDASESIAAVKNEVAAPPVMTPSLITESSIRSIICEENAKLLSAIEGRLSSMEDRILQTLLTKLSQK